MEVLDIGIKRSAIITHTIVMVMVFMIRRVLDCMRVMEDMGIGLLITYTLYISTT